MEKVRSMHVARHAVTGELTNIIREGAPDLSAGDLAYLDPARPHAVQIRPMLDHERPKDAIDPYPPGAMWLVWNSRSGFQLRGIVSLPAPYRKNIASNVARAIRQISKFSKIHGQLFAVAHSGADPFDKPKG